MQELAVVEVVAEDFLDDLHLKIETYLLLHEPRIHLEFIF